MLSELSARNFRCLAEARLSLHEEVTILTGRNGQGKTSLIEAACVLMRLQSPRTSSRSDFIRFGEKAAVVEGRCGERRLRFAANASTRRLAVDGAVCGRSAEYLANTSLVVWMDHGDMNMLRAGREHRRRFLDFIASQIFPDYLNALRGYERALRSRNYSLKRDAAINWPQADAYARVMEGFAVTLGARRRQLLGWLRPVVAEMHRSLSGGGELAEIELLPGAGGENLAELLQHMRAEEERARSTAVGPHRDDVRMLLHGRDASAFASEGQQRTFALAMKLAQARVLEEQTGKSPLLLIDDIFGELDRGRRRLFLEHLPRASQKIITTTSLDWAESADLRGEVWQVEAGVVAAC